jgi:hypothetical protein
MPKLADMHYPGVEPIRAVLDNLSTHSAGAPCRSRGASAAGVIAMAT